MIIHATCQSHLLIFFKRICCHCNNWNLRFVTVFQFSNSPGCFISVHNRHLNIHQNQTVVILLCFVKHINTCNAVLRSFYHDSLFRQKFRCNFCVQVIIFYQKNPFSFQFFDIQLTVCMFRIPFFRICYF